jgi:hypothetical protein
MLNNTVPQFNSLRACLESLTDATSIYIKSIHFHHLQYVNSFLNLSALASALDDTILDRG